MHLAPAARRPSVLQARSRAAPRAAHSPESRVALRLWRVPCSAARAPGTALPAWGPRGRPGVQGRSPRPGRGLAAGCRRPASHRVPARQTGSPTTLFTRRTRILVPGRHLVPSPPHDHPDIVKGVGGFHIRLLGPHTFGPLHPAPQSPKFTFFSPEKHIRSNPTASKVPAHFGVDSEVQGALQASSSRRVGDWGGESR